MCEVLLPILICLHGTVFKHNKKLQFSTNINYCQELSKLYYNQNFYKQNTQTLHKLSSNIHSALGSWAEKENSVEKKIKDCQMHKMEWSQW